MAERARGDDRGRPQACPKARRGPADRGDAGAAGQRFAQQAFPWEHPLNGPTPRRACRPALLLTLLLAACRDGPPPAAPPAPRPLAVWFSGCAAVREGPVCVPPADRKLRVWIAGRGAATFEGGRADAGVEVDDGRRYAIEVDADARTLRAVVDADGGRGAWTLPLAAQAPLPALDEAAALRKAGKLEEAERVLRAARPAADAEGAARIGSMLARVVLARGDAEAALKLLDETAAQHAALGRVSDASDDRHAAAFVRTSQVRRFSEARATLARQPVRPDTYPDGAIRQAYYEGVLALATGDARSALASLRGATALAERAGLDRIRFLGNVELALVLRMLGRFDEAVALLERLLRAQRPDASPCDRATALNNLAWTAIVAADARREPPAGAEAAALESALALYEGECRHLQKATTARVHLALLGLARGDPALARRHHDAATASLPADAPELRHWLAYIEARVAFAGGDGGRALAHFRRLAAAVDPDVAVELAWRTRLGAGEALASLGRIDAAIEEWTLAERLLDSKGARIPLAEGLDSFLGRHERSAELLVDALFARGRAAEAFAAARRSRTRVLDGFYRAGRLHRLPADRRRRWDEAIAAYRAEREALEKASAGDWRLPEDELARARARREASRERLRAALDDAFAALVGDAGAPAPLDVPPGDVALLYHPGRTGWIGFAATRDEVLALRLDEPPDAAGREALARWALVPFADTLAKARRIRVLAYGAVRALDLHALPLGGRALVEHAPVLYALDLSAEARPVVEPAPGALVIADPGGDLPAARAEADVVAAKLATRFAVHRLTGDAAAGDALRRAMPAASLLHYAGHGAFAGRGGWDSELPLAGGGALTVGDILALPRVPRIVVLSGCETARTAQQASAENVGLAQAFVAAGASTAIAAARVVVDADAGRLMASFYENLEGSEPAEALRRAQLDLRTARPGADWSAFRVLVP